MARMDRMEPKVLTTMMTAFACANIAPETDWGLLCLFPLIQSVLARIFAFLLDWKESALSPQETYTLVTS